MDVIDVHTHAFPDSLAKRAVGALEQEGDIKACTDGRIESLLRSMDEAGVKISVVASIATKPEQFEPILSWSRAVAGDRLVPFPSVHPADPRAAARVGEIAAAGFVGIKLHPYYQRFSLDEPRIIDLFGHIADAGLVCLLHTGFDLAFPRDRVGDPRRIKALVDAVPGLKLVATHFGAWQDWDEVERYLLGRPIYMDTSYSIEFMGTERAAKFLCTHPKEFVLFGTDSPWADQRAEIDRIRSISLDPERERLLLCQNAARLLGGAADYERATANNTPVEDSTCG